MLFINEVNIKKKRVLIRVDFNVPLNSNSKITDDNRIRAAIPTIKHAIEQQAKVIICSHLGRPKKNNDPDFSLKPVKECLENILKKEIKLSPYVMNPEIINTVESLKEGEILMLENLRYSPEEIKNGKELSRFLASLCDIYVNDAFAVSHRAHASVAGITEYSNINAAGFIIKKELEYFKKVMTNPKRPLVAIVGGAKVNSKLDALNNLLNYADKIIIGGAMANTFLKSLNYQIGKSKCEKESISAAKDFIKKTNEKKIKLYMPIDCLVSKTLSSDAKTKITTAKEVPSDSMIVDIGPATSLLYQEALLDSKTIIWNGPMGAFEIKTFSRGTMDMVSFIAKSTALSIVGGGDTGSAVKNANKHNEISYISTGGGSFLAMLSGESLPAIKALK